MEILVTLAPPSECVEQPNTRQTLPRRPYYRTVALTKGINQQAAPPHGAVVARAVGLLGADAAEGALVPRCVGR